MIRPALLMLLVLSSPSTRADTPWQGTSALSRVTGGGDVAAIGGAAVDLAAESTGEAPFIGAITSVDAAPFRGQSVQFVGQLRVDEGTGPAALWMRADGPDGKLAFASSGQQPVLRGQGVQARALTLHVPEAATRLRFGVTLGSAGRVRAEQLRLTATAAAAPAVSAHDMLAHALPLIRERALNAARVDWAAEEAGLASADLDAQPADAAYPHLRHVLDALADRHSFLQAPEDARVSREGAVATEAVQARALGDVAYLSIPGLRGTDSQAGAAFASTLCNQITNLAATSPKGWVLDLRQNTGGNMWPMINGLSPLLGSHPAGAARDRDGTMRPWRARQVPGCTGDLSRMPVAVLTGPRTASAGEAVAVAFRARPATRFFGQRSAGLATANTRFALPDGGNLLLTTAVMVDRQGTAYPDGIIPDAVVPPDQDAREAAAQWLRALP